MSPGTRVVNVRRDKADVYIGRPSKWGNPFVIGRDGDRAEVLRKYRRWLVGQPELIGALSELRGKTIGCFCAPGPCHGDVLAAIADATTPGMTLAAAKDAAASVGAIDAPQDTLWSEP